jgi:hypothetical protein
LCERACERGQLRAAGEVSFEPTVFLQGLAQRRRGVGLEQIRNAVLGERVDHVFVVGGTEHDRRGRLHLREDVEREAIGQLHVGEHELG